MKLGIKPFMPEINQLFVVLSIAMCSRWEYFATSSLIIEIDCFYLVNRFYLLRWVCLSAEHSRPVVKVLQV